ncbi:MAG: type II toxin-antitoxin system VapC family toxin [Sphingobacteriales bacterium]|nr:type II toxin-antitoxin system VapC family toxin [Sphingobacteriales bacterium]MBI3717081.1 type II toxin-antitoxin system VapC family toxin [Sphingobacteriales bacterium]
MSGNKYLLDTNIIVYALKGLADVRPYFDSKPFISVVTEIEVLGVKDLSDREIKIRETAIEFCSTVAINTKIKLRAIELKRTVKMAIPDAIIAATAIEEELTLVTADKGFKRINELSLELLEW